MIRCSCNIVTTDPKIVGVQRGLKDEPYSVLWNCAKGSTHAILVRDASARMLGEAYRIEMEGQRKAGAV